MKAETSRKFVGAFLLGILIFFVLIAYIFTTINNQTNAKQLRALPNGATVMEYTNPHGDRTVKYEGIGRPERLFVYSPNSLHEELSEIDYNPDTGILIFTIKKQAGTKIDIYQKKYRIEGKQQQVTLLGGQPLNPDGTANIPVEQSGSNAQKNALPQTKIQTPEKE
ncbi:hypothetical protein JD969_01565 [Planctomycetota bacterium]|nr:hypothetical protein JD969_01565 [Planctomycetota bacterium]